MLLISGQFISNSKILLNRVTDRIQTSITIGIYNRLFLSILNRCLCHNAIILTEMTLGNLEVWSIMNVIVLENLVNPLWRQLFVFLVGYLFHSVTNFLAHLLRHGNRKVLFQYVTDSTLTGLAVDTDNIGIVRSANIHRIDWKIWNCPCVKLLLFSPRHTFGDRILMRTGKCREYQITSIRLTVIYLHSGQTLIHFADMWHIGKIELRINSIGIHVHCDCDDIHVTGTLSVSK